MTAPAIAPAALPGPQPSALVDPRAEARARRIQLIKTQGKIVKWIIRGAYAMVLVVALVGQTTGVMNKIDLPWWLAGIAMLVTEGLGATFATIANYRRKLGEQAWLSFALATGFAAFAIWVNYTGHADSSMFLAWFFAVFSAAGFTLYVVDSAFGRRDQLWLDGKLDELPPVYGIIQWVSHPLLTRQAKALAVEDPSLGRTGSLNAAREKEQQALAAAREEERQEQARAALGQALEVILTEGIEEQSQRAIALATYDRDYIVERMRAAADNDGVADALVARVKMRRVAGAPAPRQRTNHSHRGASSDAPEGGSPRESRRTVGARQRRIERAGGWWTEYQREHAHSLYGDRLDAGQGEMTGEELRELLGADTKDGARNMRDNKLRTRYAREVLNGIRKPSDGAALPSGIARIISERRARGLDAELSAVNASTNAPESAS